MECAHCFGERGAWSRHRARFTWQERSAALHHVEAGQRALHLRLARRLPVGVTVNAFDPGLMPGTGLARQAPAPLRWLNQLPPAIPLLRRIVSPNIHSPAESVPPSRGW